MQPRDDYFTVIHKALRRELFGVTTEAAALDWADEARVRPFVGRWQALVELLHLHSRHEDRHFFALAEKKAPGATAPLSEQHEVLGRALDAVNDVVESAVKGVEAHTVHRRIALFTGAYMPHLDTEERQVMPLLWATCSDAELAETRTAFMAETPPDVAALTMRLMLPATSPAERAAIVSLVRATAPPPIVDNLLSVAAEVLDPEDYTRLVADSAARAPAG
jgi:hypothetical protein